MDKIKVFVGSSVGGLSHARAVKQNLDYDAWVRLWNQGIFRTGSYPLDDLIAALDDADFGAFAWFPADDRLSRWMDLYHQITRANRAEADAGRHLVSWVREAGFSEIEASSSNWTYQRPDDRMWWGGLWADRCADSGFANQAVDYGFADVAELAAIADAWRAWADEPDGFFMVPHVEVLARP